MAPMSVSGKRIFILGDSLSLYRNTPGGAFADDLRARGATVTLNAKSGRSAASFFHGEDGTGILAAAAAQRPDVVYVMLGTNDIWVPNKLVDARYMARIRDAFGGAEVWGVGPPAFSNAKTSAGAADVVKMMRGVFPRFIDVRPLTPPGGRSPDGIHFTGAGGIDLGRRIAAAAVSRQGAIGRVVVAVAVGAGAWYLFSSRR